MKSQENPSQNPKIPKGYKQTEVGVIPNDWAIKKLEDLCEKIQDGTHFSPSDFSGNKKYITSKNIGFGKINFKNIEYISDIEHKKIYNRCDVKSGEVLFTKDGANTGNAAINPFMEEISLLSSVAFFRTKKLKLNSTYLLQIILSKPLQNYFQKEMSGNAITRLTLNKLNLIPIPLPPTLAEQEKIAEVLSDTDAYIEKLESILQKKKWIKQGAMQELLTGKKRLAGKSNKAELRKQTSKSTDVPSGYKMTEVGVIPEDWVVRKIGDFCNISTGKKNTQDNEKDGIYPFFVRSQNVERISTYSFDGEAVLTAGDGVGTGKIFHYINGKFDYHQRVYKMSDFQNVNGYYFFLSFSTKFYNRLIQMTAKSSVDSIRLEMIDKMPIPLPPTLAEQEKIAEVLSNMDAEIEKIESKIEKYKHIKKGMMQKLLTGQLRLV